tara:strand:- start:20 stop:274 length:255 start_codon:yes stop_codon:yes gene_type:complete
MSGRIGNFKIGDLVTLSAYGKSTSQNECVADAVEFGNVTYGMITKFSHHNANYPITVQWVGYTGAVTIPTAFFFRELKYYRGVR